MKEVFPRRTVWSGAPDCPAPHAGLSGAPGAVAQQLVLGGTGRQKTIGLSGVTSGVSGVKSLRANGHLWCQSNG
jgi:hypothetical protein